MKKLFTLLTLLVFLGGGKSWGQATIIFDASDAGWSADGVNLASGSTTVNNVTWYGRSMASTAIPSDNHTFADGVTFTKYFKPGGKSTYKSGTTNAGVLTYTPTTDGTLKVYCKGGGSGDRIIYLTQSAATSTANDPTIAIETINAGNDYAILDAYVEAGKEVVVYFAQTMFLYGMTFEESNSDLTLSASSALIAVSSSSSFTYTTSSAGAVTVSSSSDEIATASVNTATNTVTVNGVAAGTATITVSQAANGSYTKGVKKFTVNVNDALALSGTFLIPSGTLDLSDADAASTMLNKAWTYDRPYFGNDGDNNYLTYTVYSAFSSKNNETWVQVPTDGDNTGASTPENWSASGVFKGYESYSSNKTATGQSGRTYTFYSFRVKGVSKVQVLVKGSAANAATLAAYEITAGTPASSTILYNKCTSTSVQTLELSLDNSKEYLLTVNNALNTSNSRFYEMALFYDDAVTLYEAVTPAKEYVTYVTTNAVDFTGLGVKGYIATAASASSVSLDEVTKVPAKTPLVLKGTASTEYKLPVCATVAAPASNLLKAGDGTTSIGGDSYDYILSDGKFYHASPAGPVAVGKAYLHLDDEPAAAGREFLEIEIDGYATGINMVNGEGLKVNGSETYYDLQGRRVLYPTKGLYIVNGKKVVIK